MKKKKPWAAMLLDSLNATSRRWIASVSTDGTRVHSFGVCLTSSHCLVATSALLSPLFVKACRCQVSLHRVRALTAVAWKVFVLHVVAHHVQ